MALRQRGDDFVEAGPPRPQLIGDGMEARQGSGKPARVVVLAEPRGFCAGVRRAIAMVERALEVYGPPVYVLHQIVHNHIVVSALRSRGARFVDSEQEVPEGAVCVLSAHGVAPAVRSRAAERGLRVLDATCPLVAKVHQEAVRHARQHRAILLIGHAEHEEVEGVYGEAPDNTVIVQTVAEAERVRLPEDSSPVYLTQTTLSLDETSEIVETLAKRFPGLEGPVTDDICYATQNRQNAVKAIAAQVDLVLVIGSRNSSNSLRMVEVARAAGTRACLVPDLVEFDETCLEGVRSLGLSSGASVPDLLVEQVLARVAELGFTEVRVERSAQEDTVFAMPQSLANAAPAVPSATRKEGT
jgi:4-hydroxy-3-methylbut-2-en-1-yl diphosphate reductase